MKGFSIAVISLLAVLAVWAWLGRGSASRSIDAPAGANPPAPKSAAEISPPAPDLRQPVASAPSGSAQPPAPELSQPRAPSTVEVRVLFDDHPLVGATVRLVPFDATSRFLIGGDPPPELARTTSDGDGLARFERCSPGDFGVAAASDGAEARTRFLVTPDAQLVRLVLPLGSATLEGEVRDLDGRRASSALVLVRQDASAGESSAWFAAKTDAGASYRLGGLAGGAGRWFHAIVLDQPLGESTPFELAENEIRRLDFGSASGRASWAGVVRFPSGAACAGPGRLSFAAASGSTGFSGQFDERGNFRAVLPAGNYVAHLDGPGGIALGTADVEGAVEQDLSLPKIVLRGRIRYVGEKHPIPKGPEDGVILELIRDGAGTIQRGPLRGSSRYVFYGLEPGSYALVTSPWIVAGSADRRASIQIGPGSDEVELDLSITDP